MSQIEKRNLERKCENQGKEEVLYGQRYTAKSKRKREIGAILLAGTALFP